MFDVLPAQLLTMLLVPIITAVLVLVLAGIAALYGGRWLLRRWTTVQPSQSLMQAALSARSTPLDTLLFLELRSESGDAPLRPMGSQRPRKSFELLDLVPAQLASKPAAIDADVDLAVELGPCAPRPVTIQLPVYVSGMGYGLALSRDAKLALARGAALAGTAINSGEGAWLPEELTLSYRWIWQLGRGAWTHRPDLIRMADMVEIHIGQGSEFGAPLTKPPDRLGDRLLRPLDMSSDQPPTIPSNLNWQGRPVSLSELVAIIRNINPVCPVGVKIGGTAAIEADIAAAVAADIDFIVIDGEEAGSGDAPASLNESVGTPLLHSFARAVVWLETAGLRESISLIASGGLRTPADFVRMLALGADAVAIGTAALFAIAHRQFDQTFPGPPLQLVRHRGEDSHLFQAEMAAHNLANFLESCRKELQLLLRTVGKRNVRELDRSDLCCSDRQLALDLGVRYSGDSFSPLQIVANRLTHVARRAGRETGVLLYRTTARPRRRTWTGSGIANYGSNQYADHN